MLRHKPYTTKVFQRGQVMGLVSRPMGKERGRAKVSGGPGKKFPEPISGESALMKHRQFLSEEDRCDVFLYPEVFYLRRPWSNYKAPSSGFSFEQHGHIRFQYEQISVLGKGTFGIVVKCFDHKAKAMVAVNLVKDVPAEHQQLLNERNYMTTLMEFENGCHNNHIVSLLDHFSFRGFSCFVTVGAREVRCLRAPAGNEVPRAPSPCHAECFAADSRRPRLRPSRRNRPLRSEAGEYADHGQGADPGLSDGLRVQLPRPPTPLQDSSVAILPRSRGDIRLQVRP